MLNSAKHDQGTVFINGLRNEIHHIIHFNKSNCLNDYTTIIQLLGLEL